MGSVERARTLIALLAWSSFESIAMRSSARVAAESSRFRVLSARSSSSARADFAPPPRPSEATSSSGTGGALSAVAAVAAVAAAAFSASATTAATAASAASALPAPRAPLVRATCVVTTARRCGKRRAWKGLRRCRALSQSTAMQLTASWRVLSFPLAGGERRRRRLTHAS